MYILHEGSIYSYSFVDESSSNKKLVFKNHFLYNSKVEIKNFVVDGYGGFEQLILKHNLFISKLIINIKFLGIHIEIDGKEKKHPSR